MSKEKQIISIFYIISFIIGTICIVAFLEETEKRIAAMMILSAVLIFIQFIVETFFLKKKKQDS